MAITDCEKSSDSYLCPKLSLELAPSKNRSDPKRFTNCSFWRGIARKFRATRIKLLTNLSRNQLIRSTPAASFLLNNSLTHKIL
jgi:hypothetical protein